eukprot:407398_1
MQTLSNRGWFTAVIVGGSAGIVMYSTYKYLCNNSRKIQQHAWKLWYNYFSSRLTRSDMNLINWGFYNEEAHKDYMNGDHAAFKKLLYEKVLFLADSNADFNDKRV